MTLAILAALAIVNFYVVPRVLLPRLVRRQKRLHPDAASQPKPRWFYPLIGTMCAIAVLSASWHWDAGRPDPISLVLCTAAVVLVWVRWARRR